MKKILLDKEKDVLELRRKLREQEQINKDENALKAINMYGGTEADTDDAVALQKDILSANETIELNLNAID